MLVCQKTTIHLKFTHIFKVTHIFATLKNPWEGKLSKSDIIEFGFFKRELTIPDLQGLHKSLKNKLQMSCAKLSTA